MASIPANPNTLSGALAIRVRENPQRTFLLDRGKRVTFAAVEEESRRIAHALMEMGVMPGDRVAVWLPNVTAWLVSFFACARLGAIVVSVNTRFRSAEVADVLARSGAKVLFFWPSFRNIDFQGILADVDAGSLGALEFLVVYDEEEAGTIPQSLVGKPVKRYRDLATGPEFEGDRGAPDTGCVIFTTSGTTRAPKFVLHAQSSILRHASDVAARLAMQAPGSTILLSVPLAGTFGFTQAMAAFSAGATVVMNPVFSIEDSLQSIAAHQITHMVAGDGAIDQIMTAATGPSPFATVKVCGFAVFSPGLENFGDRSQKMGLPLVGVYGSSEVHALFALQSVDAPLDDRLNGGGFPVCAEAQVRVRDPETQCLLPHGERGELEIKSPTFLMDYFQNPEAWQKAITADGFFRTGDLGYTLENGSFVYLSRLDDGLRLGGMLVSPAEIEAVIEEHPSIAECQIVGVEAGGEHRSFAFVIGKPGEAFEEREIIDHCKHRLARNKVPVRVHRIDAFPSTQSANATKIQKVKLRELAQRLLE